MPIYDLFSKRQKRERGEVPDVFQYTDIPNIFRVQVVHILRDVFPIFNNNITYSQSEAAHLVIFRHIHQLLCKEYGMFSLGPEAQEQRYHAAVYNFFLTAEDTDIALDVIELCFQVVSADERRDPAIRELNERFLEHGIGFQFESNQIVRIDSKFIHKEIVKPVLQLLNDPIFAGANEEFLKAHEHYRHGNHKECLNECLKAFESSMKAICQKRKWTFKETDTAKALLDICFREGLIPSFLQAHFSSLRSGLESGVPTVRNKLSGHGQGSQQIVVPGYFVRYMLNLTATSILLLIEAEKELP